jgi:hypothetical protein
MKKKRELGEIHRTAEGLATHLTLGESRGTRGGSLTDALAQAAQVANFDGGGA